MEAGGVLIPNIFVLVTSTDQPTCYHCYQFLVCHGDVTSARLVDGGSWLRIYSLHLRSLPRQQTNQHVTIVLNSLFAMESEEGSE
jgi:hypothetical protein